MFFYIQSYRNIELIISTSLNEMFTINRQLFLRYTVHVTLKSIRTKNTFVEHCSLFIESTV